MFLDYNSSIDFASYTGLIAKTLLAARWSFLLFVNFSFCWFSRDLYESLQFFFFENQQELSESDIFSQVALCTSERLYSFFSSLQQQLISGMLQSWMQTRPLLWLFFVASEYFNCDLLVLLRKTYCIYVRRFLFSFSFEISTTSSDSHLILWW